MARVETTLALCGASIASNRDRRNQRRPGQALGVHRRGAIQQAAELVAETPGYDGFETGI
jgi:hypothetical protein